MVQFNFSFYIGAQLIDNVGIVLGVQQSDSIIHLRVSIHGSVFKKINLFIVLAGLGLHCCKGVSLLAVSRLDLAVVASLVEHGLWARGLQ